MKKIFVTAVLALSALSMNAKVEDFGLFDHLGIGVEVGTTGIGINVAAPINNHIQVRAGYNFLPSIKVKDIKVDISGSKSDWENIKTQVQALRTAGAAKGETNEKLEYFASTYMKNDLPDEVLITGEPNLNNAKLLVDLFPSKNSSFRFTVGFYAGKSQVVEAYTTNCQDQLGAITYYNQNFANQTLTSGAYSYTFGDKIGAKMGDYLIEPNGDQARAYIKTNGFKPYVGLGFGRAVPKKRISCAFDLGVQFWGNPKIYIDQPSGKKQIDENTGINGDGGVIKAISKIWVYPCLSFRINGRIF